MTIGRKPKECFMSNTITLTDAQLAKMIELGIIDAPKPKKVVEKWTNVTGHECSAKRVAKYTSNNIVKHLVGGDDGCGCRYGDNCNCKAVKKGHVTRATHGSVPDLVWMEDTDAKAFVFSQEVEVI
jgi:hypothetical protein